MTTMSASEQGWIEMKNEFGRREAEQEQAAFEADMDAEMADAAPVAQSLALQEAATVRRFVAERCCLCGTKLDDPKSIETGVGPDCRKRHGYDVAQTDADWPAVCEALGRAGAEGLYSEVVHLLFKDARRCAKVVVHRMAVEGNGAVAIALVNVVLALGYKKLAARAAKRLAELEVKVEGEELVFTHPYSGSALGVLHFVPGITWRKGAHRCPLASKAELLGAVKLGFPKMVVSTPDGLMPTEELPSFEFRSEPVGGVVVIEYTSTQEFSVKLPAYHALAIADFKRVPGRWYHSDSQTNRFPRTRTAEVNEILKKHFRGARCRGPKGEFVIGAEMAS